MASTYSTEWGLELQANGENSGTWGTKTNTNLQLIEEGGAGYDSTIDLSSASATLTMSNGASSTARHAILHIEGTLTANRTVTVPSTANQWLMHNATSGAFTVTVKTSGGSGYALPQGARGVLYSDGTDVYLAGELAADLTPTLEGTLNAQDNVIQRAKFKDSSEEQTTPSSSSNVLTLDLENGNVFETTLTEAVTTLTISNPPATGDFGYFVLELIQDGTGGWAVTFPAAVKWADNGTAPTLTTAAGTVSTLVFYTTDAGTTWIGSLFGDDFA